MNNKQIKMSEDEALINLIEERKLNAAHAWFQTFNYGLQDYYRKASRLRARAVRRLPI